MFNAFDFVKDRDQGGKVGSVLGENASFNGLLSFSGAVRIDGKFEGEIKTDGDVIIGKKGEVRANITAGCVVVGGRVEGNVTATRRLELQSQSQLIGDIRTSNLVVGEGVLLQGNCRIEQTDIITPKDLGMIDVKTKKSGFYKVVKSKQQEVSSAKEVGEK
jgi:cytoskeletal protein CcmA (bactofilin family)